MQAYILRRLLWLIPVLLFVSLMTFTIMKLTPGGPWDREKQLAPQVVENLNRKYGLDQPVYVQYLTYVWNAAHGDLGPSFTYQDRNVTEIILGGLPATVTLGLCASVLALVLGFPLGVVAALRRNSWIDYLCLFVATTGASIPSFVLGILLMIVFALALHLLPTSGWGEPRNLILPAITLGFPQAAFLARITRASMLEALRQDYVRTARAKGLHEQLVLWRHILKNALIPVLTVLGPLLAFLLTGSVIVESIFAVPGTGRLFVESIHQRDYSLIMGTTLFFAFVIAVMNLLVDIAYAVVDPRISYR